MFVATVWAIVLFFFRTKNANEGVVQKMAASTTVRRPRTHVDLFRRRTVHKPHHSRPHPAHRRLPHPMQHFRLVCLHDNRQGTKTTPHPQDDNDDTLFLVRRTSERRRWREIQRRPPRNPGRRRGRPDPGLLGQETDGARRVAQRRPERKHAQEHLRLGPDRGNRNADLLRLSGFTLFFDSCWSGANTHTHQPSGRNAPSSVGFVSRRRWASAQRGLLFAHRRWAEAN